MAAMQKHVLLKDSFSPKLKIDSFFTGNRIELTRDGRHLFCARDHILNVINLDDGKVEKQLKCEEEDIIITFTLSPDDKTIIISHQSGLLRRWTWDEERIERTWKSIHVGPIACMTFDSSSTYLATAGSDSTIKVWDLIRQYFTHNLKGAQGVFSCVLFSPSPSENKYLLYGAADDYKVHVWDLVSNQHMTQLEGHCSKITCIQFTPDSSLILTGSRDKIVFVWDSVTHQKVRSIPVFESIESLIIPGDKVIKDLKLNKTFITGGEKGVLRVWDFVTGSLLYTQENSILSLEQKPGESLIEAQSQLIIQCVYCEESGQIVVVSYENNIIFHKIEDFSLVKQLIGHNDEVLDVKLIGTNETHLAVATNSPHIKVFEISSSNCCILKGHTDIVMSLDTFACDPYVMVSCSKDNSVRVWRFDPETMQATCSYVGTGHSHSVISVCAPNVGSSFFVSGSEDTTLKVWKVPKKSSEVPNCVSLIAKSTQHAHEKTINSVAVSPNDQLVATGSQDKTAKIWSADNLRLMGVMRGHRKGIWCVQFSPVDQVLVTGSADTTIKLWTLADYTCIKTLQGHDSSVLKITFIDRGMQLISTSSDGNIKIWNIKHNECIKTIDAHNDKIWALTKSKDEHLLITGGSDSMIVVWEDVTEIEREQKALLKENEVEAEQSLRNLLHNKKWRKALKLAVKLNHPFRALGIIKEMLIDLNEMNRVEEILLKMRDDQLLSLFNYALTWNTNSKHYIVAQCVFKCVYQKIPPEELLKLTDFKQKVESFMPYTERHVARLNRLQQQVTFIDFVWQNIKLPDIKQNEINAKMEDVRIGVEDMDDVQYVAGSNSESDSDVVSIHDED